MELGVLKTLHANVSSGKTVAGSTSRTRASASRTESSSANGAANRGSV